MTRDQGAGTAGVEEDEIWGRRKRSRGGEEGVSYVMNNITGAPRSYSNKLALLFDCCNEEDLAIRSGEELQIDMDWPRRSHPTTVKTSVHNTADDSPGDTTMMMVGGQTVVDKERERSNRACFVDRQWTELLLYSSCGGWVFSRRTLSSPARRNFVMSMCFRSTGTQSRKDR